jgi:hypothetical protein
VIPKGGGGRRRHPSLCVWYRSMRWIFALSKFELVLFIVSVTVLVLSLLLLLEIAGVALVDWL